MKKRGYIGRLAAVAMVLCLVTMSLTSGTLAKYASEASGNAKATVAKWSVAFKDGANDPFSSTSVIELKPDNAKWVATNLVVDGKIAPEITGQLDLKVDGSGTEVAFDYTIEVNVGGVTVDSGTTTEAFPLKFYSNATCLDAEEIKDNADDATDGKISFTDSVLTNAGSKEATKTIYWKWVGVDNTHDTTLGENSAEAGGPVAFKIPVTIKAEQKTA